MLSRLEGLEIIVKTGDPSCELESAVSGSMVKQIRESAAQWRRELPDMIEIEFELRRIMI